MGLRNLGMVNVIATTFSVPMFFALYVVHRKSDPVYATLALIISLMGATMYIAGNNAFAMWVLSNKYAVATTDLQQSQLLAAGEALLAQAESHTPGTFVYFLYTEFASVSISIVMLRGKIFGKLNAYAGILGFCFLFVFEVISSFYPAWFRIGMIFVAFGGLMSVGWYFLIGRRLLQLAKI